jgi:hypothetical protein
MQMGVKVVLGLQVLKPNERATLDRFTVTTCRSVRSSNYPVAIGIIRVYIEKKNTHKQKKNHVRELPETEKTLKTSALGNPVTDC